MNKQLLTAGLIALGLGTAMADMGAPAPSVKDMEVAIDETNYVETAYKGVVLSGYVDAGYTYNMFGDGTTGIRGRSGTVDQNNKGDFSLHAVNLTLEKALSDANELQGGFKVSLMFGEDITAHAVSGTNLGGTGAGGNSSDFNVMEAFATFRIPYGNGIDIRAGKFNGYLGYEYNERHMNMNISYSPEFFGVTSFGVGVDAFYAFNDNVSFMQAITNGTNADSSTAVVNEFNDSYAITGLLMISNNDGNANINFGYFLGLDDASGFTSFASAPAGDRDILVLGHVNGTWLPKFANDKLTLGFSSTIGDGPTDGIGSNIDTTTTWVTTALYSKYQFTDLFSLAGRFTHTHASDNNFFAGTTTGSPSNDLFTYTLTAGFDLTENLLFRTEYRVDWMADGDDSISANTPDEGPAHTIAAQVVYTF